MNTIDPRPELPVIFRAEKSGPFKGSITAVFPTMPADYEGRQLTCYSNEGHSGGSWEWYQQRTRAARPEEYVELLAAARRLYEHSQGEGDEAYLLKVYRRMQPEHRNAFNAEVRNLRRQLPYT
jgi:hypothetical protein